MKHPTLTALALFALAAPSFAFAATVQTDSWQINVSESADQQLTFSVAPRATQAPSDGQDTSTDVSEPIAPALMEGVEGELLLNEFVSDPVSGSQEWVELYNPSGRTVELSGWVIREGSGRDTELSGSLAAGHYLVVSSPNGSLNNGGDAIQLIDPFENVIDHLAYGTWTGASMAAVSDPQSMGRDPQTPGLFRAMQPTPGTANEEQVTAATATEEDETTAPTTTDQSDTLPTTQDTYDTPVLGDGSADGYTTCPAANTDSTSDAPSSTTNEDVASFVPLANIRTLDIGTELTTEGVVSVVPGVLGQQYFYLAGSGVQVYLYSADFPTLLRGDRLRIHGELSQANGETRVKLGSASDITVLEHGDAPEPHDVTGGQIGEATEGWLVRMTGSVTEKQSDEFMLSDDEADVRIVIRDTTGILLDVEEGDELTVTGIVSETRSGYRLLPRDQQDLLPRTSTETSTTSQAAAGLLNATKHSGTGGWFISGATVISLFAGAAHHLYKQKKWLFA